MLSTTYVRVKNEQMFGKSTFQRTEKALFVLNSLISARAIPLDLRRKHQDFYMYQCPSFGNVVQHLFSPLNKLDHINVLTRTQNWNSKVS